MHPAPTRLAIAGLVVLATLGIATASLRVARAGMGLAHSPAQAAFDTAYVHAIFASTLVPQDDPRHAEMENNFVVGERKYDAHPVATLLHVVPGILFMILAPLQLVRGLRARRPALHRWSGRVLLAAGACIAGSALFIGWVAPGAGRRESVVITIIATFFVVAAARAWLAIRRADRAAHREWMLRFLAAGLAISTVRLVSIPMAIVTTGVSIETAFIWSMMLGWALTIGAAEWWIRRTRVAEPRAVLEPLAVHR